MDVNLLSKDMELNFSNKNEDEDELENLKVNGTIDKDQDEGANEDDKERFGGEEQKGDFKMGKKDPV